MYIIIKPVKQEEDFICVEIAQISDTDTPFYRRVFETEQEIYVYNTVESVKRWCVEVAEFFSWEMANKIIPAKFDYFSFEFDYATKTVRIIRGE